MQVPASNSTRFGFNRTRLPRTSNPQARAPSNIGWTRSAEYEGAFSTATADLPGGPSVTFFRFPISDVLKAAYPPVAMAAPIPMKLRRFMPPPWFETIHGYRRDAPGVE